MIIRPNMEKTLKLPYNLTALVDLSGSTIAVDTLNEAEGDCVFIMTDECVEPVFMSPTETELLIAALQAAKENFRG